MAKKTHPVNGKKILDLRWHKLMTQEELAKATGLTDATIRNLERGRSTNVHASTLKLLAKGLGCEPNDLRALSTATREEA
jgi:transcriptional regulator with XRE-family HTH domain